MNQDRYKNTCFRMVPGFVFSFPSWNCCIFLICCLKVFQELFPDKEIPVIHNYREDQAGTSGDRKIYGPKNPSESQNSKTKKGNQRKPTYQTHALHYGPMEAADDRVELKPVLARTSLSFVLSFDGPRAFWPAKPAAG